MFKTCLHCKTSITPRKWEGPKNFSKRKYCSKDCTNKAKTGLRKPITTRTCKNCPETFRVYPSDTKQYCSKPCADEARTTYTPELKPCPQCNQYFFSRKKPFSNSTGEFCSKKCKCESGAKPENLRSGWVSIRNKFIADNNDFCNRCGKDESRLHVHHIEPVRFGNNEPWNLMTLCPKCHSYMEKISVRIGMCKDPEARRASASLLKSLFSDKWHLYNGRKLQNEDTKSQCK